VVKVKGNRKTTQAVPVQLFKRSKGRGKKENDAGGSTPTNTTLHEEAPHQHLSLTNS
jgi:hypothetical protein